MDNLYIYEQGRAVPPEALKEIGAGRLKGMSDINPMYRIKRMTEIFGPCGFGWWYEITNKEIVFDDLTQQKAAFVDILLYVKDPKTGEASHGIPGTGGASFVASERNGKYLSDECFKMALTDAISVACKALGIAADVYYAKDRTKYTAPVGIPADKPPADFKPEPPAKATIVRAQGTPVQQCQECRKPILGVMRNGAMIMTPEQVLQASVNRYGVPICLNCANKRRKEREA